MQQVIVEEKVIKFNGDICIKKYLKGKFLGKGGFAKCYEFSNLETKRVTAAKIIQKSTLTKSRAKQKLMSEIKIHRSLHHPNIVGFEHFFEDAENVYILLELCSNQSMNELLRRRKRLHELEVQCYLMQMISALKYLHSHRVIHRDMKLGNLFINDKMEIKIGDFGLATKLEFDGERKRTICGTPNYIAPEVLEGKQGHSYEVDIWSLGVIMYTMIIGKPPFETSDVKTTYKRIRMNMYQFPENVPISEPAKDLITKILNNDPSKRPKLDELMEHPFIRHEGTIPRLLPASTLACPPSSTYIRQF
jgi:polo-like kinase 1